MDKPLFDWVRRQNGTSEFEEFLTNLSMDDRQELLAVIERTEEHGLLIAIKQKWVKKLDKDMYELRSSRKGNIQRAIYFQKVGNQYLITHGFTKKTQKTPKREIEHAKDIRENYKKGLLK